MRKYFRSIGNCRSLRNSLDIWGVKSNLPGLFAGELALPAVLPASFLLDLIGFLLRVARSQEVIDDKISYFSAQLLSNGEVEAEMLAGEDTA